VGQREGRGFTRKSGSLLNVVYPPGRGFLNHQKPTRLAIVHFRFRECLFLEVFARVYREMGEAPGGL